MKMKSASSSTKKVEKKQWIKLGGLGPNLGGEEWTKKKILQ